MIHVASPGTVAFWRLHWVRVSRGQWLVQPVGLLSPAPPLLFSTACRVAWVSFSMVHGFQE